MMNFMGNCHTSSSSVFCSLPPAATTFAKDSRQAWSFLELISSDHHLGS